MEKKTVSLDHLNLSVRSFEESARWYAKVFGFEIVEQGMDDDGPWGILRSGDSMLCIYESPKRVALDAPDDEKFHQIFHFAFRIQDRKGWEKTLQENRLRTYYGSPVHYPHSTSWYVTDPTGYMIEVALWNGNEVKFG